MSEVEHERMDSLLREAMTAPPPGLSSNFDRQLAKRLRPQNLSLTARLVLAVYALIALLVSVWALRPLPIHWTFVWTFVIGTLAPVSLGLYWIRRRLSS